MYLFGFFCLFLALSYGVQWPKAKEGYERPYWLHLMMRWGHSAVWLLLAISCFLWYWQYNAIGGQIAANAMILYLIFVAAYMYDRRVAKNL